MSESEKALIFLLLVLLVPAAWTFGERTLFVLASESAEGRVLSTSSVEVRVTGTRGVPQGRSFDHTSYAIGFEDTSGRFHSVRALSYFTAPPVDAEFPIRYRSDAPDDDVRRGGLDLFGIPFLFVGLAIPVEVLRRRLRRGLATPRPAS